MFDAWGYGVYLFFASIMMVSVVFVFFAVPETKSIPLEAMDRLFKVKPVWRANETIMRELAEFERPADGAGLEMDKPNVNLVETRASREDERRTESRGGREEQV